MWRVPNAHTRRRDASPETNSTVGAGEEDEEEDEEEEGEAIERGVSYLRYQRPFDVM